MKAEPLRDFKLRLAGQISESFLNEGIASFTSAALLVRGFAYGRTSRPGDYLLVLKEKKGTCSSKHALLALLAEEHHQPVELKLGMFELTAASNPRLASLLAQHELHAVPEAHAYLSRDGAGFDFTGAHVPIQPLRPMWGEETVAVSDLGEYKNRYHRRMMTKWLEERGLSQRMTSEQLWQVREECIAALSPQ